MSTSCRITVVELLGAPGSGKSSLAAELLRLEGVVVLKDHQRADLPALAWSLTRAWSVATGPLPLGADRTRWAAWAARLGAAPAVTRRRLADGATVVVLDQGPAYTLGRMAAARRTRRGNAWWSARAVECAELLDLLVILDADTDSLAQRLRGRHKAHEADLLDDERLRAYLDAERLACHSVADVLAREGTGVWRMRTDLLALPEQATTICESLARCDPVKAKRAKT